MRRQILRWLLVLGALHAIVACAGFFAPYDPVQQDREHPYLPPMKVHVVDERSHLHLRPFFYAMRIRDGSFEQFDEDTSKVFPLRFLVTGEQYRLLGFLPCRAHLFGTEGTRLYLLGSDGFGRDQFSRILYGGQVSLLSGLLGAGFTLFFGAIIGTAAGFYCGGGGMFFCMVAPGFFLFVFFFFFFFFFSSFVA